MSEYDDYEDDEFEGPQGNPNLVKDLRNQLKAKAKAEKEMAARLAELESKTRKGDLAQILKSSGLDERVASLVPSSVEPTAEAVGEWLKEYGPLFGQKAETQEDAPPALQAQAAEQMNAMQQLARTGSAGDNKGRVTENDLMAAGSLQDVLDIIRKGAAQGQ